MAVSPTKYRFLELIKEGDAVTRGSQVGEKIHHAIYRTIRRLSSLDNVKAGFAFTLDTPIPELEGMNLPRKALAAVLRNLIDDRLVTQLFQIGTRGNGQLEAASCYISLPPEDTVTPNQVYYEVILRSVKNIEEVAKALPVYSKDEIRADLETDFKSRAVPPIEKLGKTLLDPIRLIVPGLFDFVPDADMLRYGRGDLKEELLRRHLFIDLFEYGMMPLKEDEILPRFEVSGDFLNSRLVPHYRDRPNLKPEMETIYMEESAYYLDPFAARNPSFLVKKATAMKKNLLGQNQEDRIRFPGMLAIEQILQLAPFVESTYKDMDRKEIQESLNEFQRRINEIFPEDWQDLALYLDDEDREEIHPEVLKSLLSSRDIMNINWETGKGTILVLAKKDRIVFENLVTGMIASHNVETWQILALKFMIEKYETDFPNLFKDAAFRNSYGRLLRKVYLRYIGFFHRILIHIGLTLFQDRAFQKAKGKILEEQGLLALRNTEKREQATQARMRERRERLARARDLGAISRVNEKIDLAFRDGRLPTLTRLWSDGKDMELPALRDFLKKASFQTIPLETKADDGKEDYVLLYPMDHNWRVRAGRLMRVLDSWEAKQSQDADPDRRGFFDMLPRLKRFLTDRGAGNVAHGRRGGQLRQEGEDPYERFNKELKKVKSEEDRELDI